MIKKHPNKKIKKKKVSYGYSRSTSELHTGKHILPFICGGTEYNNLQPKLFKAGSITFFFMLQDFKKWNGDRKG